MVLCGVDRLGVLGGGDDGFHCGVGVSDCIIRWAFTTNARMQYATERLG